MQNWKLSGVAGTLIGISVLNAGVVFISSGTAYGRISDDWDYWLPMGFNEPNIHFDHLQMKADCPEQFLTPIGYENGVGDGSVWPPDESWSQTYNNGMLMLCDGNSTSELYWQQYFADDNEVFWHLQAWDGNELVINQDILKNAGGWWTTPPDGSNVFDGTWQGDRIDNQPNIADLNLDGCVNFRDFCILASQWLSAPSCPSADIAPPGGDGVVNYPDLAVFTDNWLAGC